MHHTRQHLQIHHIHLSINVNWDSCVVMLLLHCLIFILNLRQENIQRKSFCIEFVYIQYYIHICHFQVDFYKNLSLFVPCQSQTNIKEEPIKLKYFDLNVIQADFFFILHMKLLQEILVKSNLLKYFKFKPIFWF